MRTTKTNLSHDCPKEKSTGQKVQWILSSCKRGGWETVTTSTRAVTCATSCSSSPKTQIRLCTAVSPWTVSASHPSWKWPWRTDKFALASAAVELQRSCTPCAPDKTTLHKCCDANMPEQQTYQLKWWTATESHLQRDPLCRQPVPTSAASHMEKHNNQKNKVLWDAWHTRNKIEHRVHTCIVHRLQGLADAIVSVQQLRRDLIMTEIATRGEPEGLPCDTSKAHLPRPCSSCAPSTPMTGYRNSPRASSTSSSRRDHPSCFPPRSSAALQWLPHGCLEIVNGTNSKDNTVTKASSFTPTADPLGSTARGCHAFYIPYLWPAPLGRHACFGRSWCLFWDDTGYGCTRLSKVSQHSEKKAKEQPVNLRDWINLKKKKTVARKCGPPTWWALEHYCGR